MFIWWDFFIVTSLTISMCKANEEVKLSLLSPLTSLLSLENLISVGI
jgi:hypothetical protein